MSEVRLSSELKPSPPVYPKLTSAARVSFLHPRPGQDNHTRTSGIKPKLSPKPLVLPPVPAISTIAPSKPRQPHTSWVHSAKQKEEAGAHNRNGTSFLSAVIERTSKLYGDRYTPALLQSSSTTSPVNHSTAETSHPEDMTSAKVRPSHCI